jgi:hypothetical protein
VSFTPTANQPHRRDHSHCDGSAARGHQFRRSADAGCVRAGVSRTARRSPSVKETARRVLDARL